MKTISVINQKGGVGKTTTAATLATIWAGQGKHVLAVDMDPQGNLALRFGLPYKSGRPTTYNVLTDTPADQIGILDALIKTSSGVDLLPSYTGLEDIINDVHRNNSRIYALFNALEQVANNYDYCIIDCPPRRDALTQEALLASDYCIIPTNAEAASVDGLSRLFRTVQDLQHPRQNPDLKIAGILVTRLDRNNKAELVMLEQIKHVAKENGTNLYKSEINASQSVTTASNYLRTVASEDWKRTKVSKAYYALADEISEQMEA